MNKGLFSKKYTAYKVTTHPFNWEVDRRFSDFLWLRNTLQRDFPGVYIAPMATKSGSNNKFDPLYIAGRLSLIQEFVSAIIENPEVRSSPALPAFFGGNELDFAKFRKESDKCILLNPNTAIYSSGISKKLFMAKHPVKVENLTTNSGNVECKISKALKEFSLGLKLSLKDYTAHYTKAEELCTKLADMMLQTKTVSDKLLEHIAGLHSTTKRFGDVMEKEGLARWDSLEGILYHLGETVKKQGLFMERQSVVLTDTLAKTIKYSKMEMGSLEEIVKLREEASVLFFKSYFELDGRKDKLLKTNDYNKFGLDSEGMKFPKEELKENKVIAKQLMLKEVARRVT